jgi:hypothetical protein
MTDKLYLITEAQRQQCIDSHLNNAVAILQSLPMVSAEPVAHIYPWVLERFATAETTGRAYSVAVECADGVSVPLYTSPQALTPITADDVSDKTVIDLWRIGVLTSTGTQGKEIAAKVYNAVIKHKVTK